MAAAALGALTGAAGGIMSAGVDMLKIGVDATGKVITAVRNDKGEIEIPAWAFGVKKKKGQPEPEALKIPSVLFGYLALGIGIYAVARVFGVRPFEWIVTEMQNFGKPQTQTGTQQQGAAAILNEMEQQQKAKYGQGVDGKPLTPTEKAEIQAAKTAAAEAERKKKPEDARYYLRYEKEPGSGITNWENRYTYDELTAIVKALSAAHVSPIWSMSEADLDAAITSMNYQVDADTRLWSIRNNSAMGAAMPWTQL